MDLSAELDNLQTRLSKALQYLPGAAALYLFGSCATSEGDLYSDIDLQVISIDLAASCAVWPGILEQVGPNFYRLIRLIISLVQEKADTYGEIIPVGLVEHHLSFIRTELGIKTSLTNVLM